MLCHVFPAFCEGPVTMASTNLRWGSLVSNGYLLRKLSGLALHQCIELGYHRSTKLSRQQGNALQIELRKRVFWCAQGIDCTYAVRLGRPLGIQLDEIDVEVCGRRLVIAEDLC